MAKKSPASKALTLDLPSMGKKLVRWYEKHQRDLPWRTKTDPYAIWVSEIMLQQTTVAAVLSRYQPFLDRFPTVSDLAAASEEEVLAELQGMGYYRRFRSMKKAAEVVMIDHGGELPRDFKGWLDLPGIGEYTAGAILSIAFNEPVPAVDGNVVRVMTRLQAMPGIHESVPAKRRIGEIVLAMMPKKKASYFNQALFDLGATICMPVSPSCIACPLSAHCKAHATDTVALYPEKPKKKAMVDVAVAVALIENKGRFLMLERPADANRMPGFRELPEVWLGKGEDPRHALQTMLKERTKKTAIIGDVSVNCRHTITHHKLLCTLYVATMKSTAITSGCWVSPDALDEAPTSTITRKLLMRLAKLATPAD